MASRAGFVIALSALGAAVAAWLAAAGGVELWAPVAVAPPAIAPRGPEPEPDIPLRSEMALTRARALAASGRHRDALAALDLVRSTDVQKVEADRLRTDIQRQLIALTLASEPGAGARAGSNGAVP
jgi:hypothetical protein